MSEENNANILIEKLSECSKNLSEVNTQIQTFYNTIKDVTKEIKDPKSRQELIYMYKQTYDALGKHVKSFNNLIRVVEEQATDVQPHNKEEQ